MDYNICYHKACKGYTSKDMYKNVATCLERIKTCEDLYGEAKSFEISLYEIIEILGCHHKNASMEKEYGYSRRRPLLTISWDTLARRVDITIKNLDYIG